MKVTRFLVYALAIVQSRKNRIVLIVFRREDETRIAKRSSARACRNGVHVLVRRGAPALAGEWVVRCRVPHLSCRATSVYFEYGYFHKNRTIEFALTLATGKGFIWTLVCGRGFLHLLLPFLVHVLQHSHHLIRCAGRRRRLVRIGPLSFGYCHLCGLRTCGQRLGRSCPVPAPRPRRAPRLVPAPP